MKFVQFLMMLVGALAMVSIVNAEGHTNTTMAEDHDDSDMGMEETDMDMPIDMDVNGTDPETDETADEDISAGGRISMVTAAAIVAGCFAF